jgi:hypothetical protein
MRNRAKCKLCKDVLESFHKFDYVSCKCGQIGISGGENTYECAAKDWSNFIRLDDEDNEISVKVREEIKEVPIEDEVPSRFTRDQQIYMLETMVQNIESLPKHAMNQPINHYDFYSYMLLIVSILKSPDKE